MSTELICFFLLGIAALLLNAGLSSQALPLFWLVLPLAIKLFLDTNRRRAQKEISPIKIQTTFTPELPHSTWLPPAMGDDEVVSTTKRV